MSDPDEIDELALRVAAGEVADDDPEVTARVADDARLRAQIDEARALRRVLAGASAIERDTRSWADRIDPAAAAAEGVTLRLVRALRSRHVIVAAALLLLGGAWLTGLLPGGRSGFLHGGGHRTMGSGDVEPPVLIEPAEETASFGVFRWDGTLPRGASYTLVIHAGDVDDDAVQDTDAGLLFTSIEESRWTLTADERARLTHVIRWGVRIVRAGGEVEASAWRTSRLSH